MTRLPGTEHQCQDSERGGENEDPEEAAVAHTLVPWAGLKSRSKSLARKRACWLQ